MKCVTIIKIAINAIEMNSVMNHHGMPSIAARGLLPQANIGIQYAIVYKTKPTRIIVINSLVALLSLGSSFNVVEDIVFASLKFDFKSKFNYSF